MMAIKKETITETVVELMRRAVCDLPKDIEDKIKKALKSESGIPKLQIENILENVKVARKNRVPMCQDTGVAIFYVKLGRAAGITEAEVTCGIKNGVREATASIPLRPNVVHPLTRKNTGDNTGRGIPDMDIEYFDGNHIEIVFFPKGAGSENMSAIRMLKPSDGVAGIKKFVVETVRKAGGNPCPPVIVGVGIGGTFDMAARLAKKALVSRGGKEPEISRLEKELLAEINRSGVGPMGFGGKTTALDVRVEYAYCHTASLPVAVNLQCWAAREAVAKIGERGVEYG